MCQYSLTRGLINDWLKLHLAALPVRRLVWFIVEGNGLWPLRVASTPRLRRYPGTTRWRRHSHAAVKAIKGSGLVAWHSDCPSGARPTHAWEGDDHIDASDARGWQTIAPSAIPLARHLPKTPEAMTLEDIAARARLTSLAAARRALEVGFSEWLELHFAHG